MVGYQVTLTSANTNYNLLTLVRAIDAGFVDQGEMFVQADPDGGAQIFLLGDSNLASGRYAVKMVAGNTTDTLTQIGDLGGTYARCDTNSKKLNISIRR